MSSLLEIVLAIAVIGYVIARQVRGEPLRAKRVLLLPAVLTVIGLVEISKSPIRPVDLLVLVPGAVIAAGIGLAQGRVTRLESRDGALWGQMPLPGLWLWLALIVSRVLLAGLADGLDAKAAASGAAILLTLGLNRLGQAAVIALRAQAAGIPFAPEPARRRTENLDRRSSMDVR